MCTLTFIPAGATRYLTSNRDEQTARATASLPEVAHLANGRALYPVDGKAGGTWIACHEVGNAMVLLNGAFQKHKHQPPYRTSRGLIFLQIFSHDCPDVGFEITDLSGVEPFTLVIVTQQRLVEARWDGREKFMVALDTTQPHIWSSATLYDDEVRQRREAWFEQWLEKHPQPAARDIRSFHEFAGDGDAANDLRMNRAGLLQTVSITGITLGPRKTEMHYRDLRAGLTSVHEWPLTTKQLCG